MAIAAHRFPGSDAYAARVNRLPGGPPLAFWRIASTSNFLDAMGVRHGSWTNTGGSLVTGLPQGSDGAVDFKGVATAKVLHDAGLALTAFTLSFWVRPNSVPGEEDPQMPLISKDNPGGNSAGDFFVAIVREGGFRVRFRDGVSNLDLDTALGLVEVGQTYHVCVRADSTGFDLFVNGVFQGKSTAFTGGWSSNTQDILFADDPFFVADGDCVLDEVALYSRVLAVEEVLQLAQTTSAPVATDDIASVPENTTTAIDVLSNDAYVGTPTIEIVSQPAGGDGVAVSGQQINYTAGVVSADTARSFTYRITDPNGTSNTATVSVTVQDSAFVPASNANCFLISGADTVEVGSMAALASAVNAAPPGRQILIQPGTYAGGSLSFAPSGTEANPIVIRPRDGRGTVTINSPSWTLAAGSSRLVIANIFFDDPSININGSHHRVTRCRIRQMGHHSFQLFAATDTRIDHCDVSDFLSNLNGKSFVRLRHTNVGNGSLQRVLVDYNYVHNSNPAQGVNGSDLIGLSSSSGGAAEANPGLIVDHCLFDDISLPGDGEMVGAKTSGIIFRFNTMLNTGTPCYVNFPRQGANCECRSNWFEGTADNNPLHVWHDNGLIIGNRFVGGLNMWCAAGTKYNEITAPVTGGYGASRNGRYIGNRLGSGRILVGGYWSSGGATLPALNNNLWNNTRDSGGDAHILIAGLHSATTFSSDVEPFVAAVKLTSADVGMAAPDPLCPSGPQS